MPANDPCASRVIVNVPIKTSRYQHRPAERGRDGNVDVINLPFGRRFPFAAVNGEKRDGDGGVGKSETACLGQAGVKASFQRSHCPRVPAQRGARHQRRVKVIAGGCTSPILAVRAANKPFRLFDRRDSAIPVCSPRQLPSRGKESLSDCRLAGISDAFPADEKNRRTDPSA